MNQTNAFDHHRGAPHGGVLVNLLASPERVAQLQDQSREMTSITLSSRQLSDLELLLNGTYSPLTGFMSRTAYQSALETLRTPEGHLWPLPICLDIHLSDMERLSPGQVVALRDTEGFMVAALTITDLWTPDKTAEAEAVFGTADPRHPGVERLIRQTGAGYVGGTVEGIQYPLHFAFRRLRHPPAEMRALYRKLGWRRVVAFHTRNPIHRPQLEVTLRAMAQARANLLLHPVVQRVKTGDIDAYTRIRCYMEITHKYPPNMMMLSLLPFPMRMAGPREALLHAIMRKNYGCTHFIVGPHHASPAEDGHSFYPPEAARELLLRHGPELDMGIVPFDRLQYVKEADDYLAENEMEPGDTCLEMSNDEFHARLRSGRRVPEWYTFPRVIEALRKAYPPRHRQGFTVFCTGLSGAGKSTIARILYARFLEMGGRPVTLLDGDIVRLNLSSELGFSKAHRDINVRRIGFVASEITKNRGIAICAPIAPYAETRKAIREAIEIHGGFVEVHVATPLDVCEGRDRKGLYAKARAGLIQGFTGINDPYEPPEQAEARIDTTELTPDESAQEILLYLERAGYIR